MKNNKNKYHTLRGLNWEKKSLQISSRIDIKVYTLRIVSLHSLKEKRTKFTHHWCSHICMPGCCHQEPSILQIRSEVILKRAFVYLQSRVHVSDFRWMKTLFVLSFCFSHNCLLFALKLFVDATQKGVGKQNESVVIVNGHGFCDQ